MHPAVPEKPWPPQTEATQSHFQIAAAPAEMQFRNRSEALRQSHPNEIATAEAIAQVALCVRL